MSERVFIDTNVFVNADDADQPAKRAIARKLIQQLAADERGVVSTQVLVEYVSAAHKKLGLSFADCRRAVLLMGQLDVAIIRPEHILGAIDLASLQSLSLWDALILRVAAASKCGRLVTEDLNDGQVIDGVRIENPFTAAVEAS